MTQKSSNKSNIGIWILILVLIVLIAAGGFVLIKAGEKTEAQDRPIFVVKKGPLKISVVESGTIKARQQEIIKSEVEGRTTILSLVPEGDLIKKGDLLVELDSAKLIDQSIDQEIRVQNSEASFIRSRENLAVAENQAESDIDKAELSLEFSKQDLKKYIEGEYPNDQKELRSRITLADADLKRAEEKLKWSKDLYKEKYISQTELQADQLSTDKNRLEKELAVDRLRLLEEFTHKRRLAQLESDVKQAEMALERTNRKAKANVIQAQADLRAKESEFERQKNKLKKIEEQIVKTKIYAPADGLVIYASSAKSGGWRHSNREPLEEGQEVREREELIYLPTASEMKAETKIHEASMKKVTLDMPAKITVDALQGKVFSGYVNKIAPLPDAQSMFLNPDLKVYNTEIFIDDKAADMRTGMSCKVEIIVETYKDALYVPLQAVIRVKGRPTVYVIKDDTIEPVGIKIGLDNNRMVHVTDGLKEGDKVLLAPPLGAGEVDETIDIFDANMPEVKRVARSRNGDRGGRGGRRSRRDRDPNEQGGEKKRRKRPEGVGDMTREQMREKYENMTDEEKEKMREQFKKRNQQGSDND